MNLLVNHDLVLLAIVMCGVVIPMGFAELTEADKTANFIIMPVEVAPIRKNMTSHAFITSKKNGTVTVAANPFALRRPHKHKKSKQQLAYEKCVQDGQRISPWFPVWECEIVKCRDKSDNLVPGTKWWECDDNGRVKKEPAHNGHHFATGNGKGG
ncbi:hypothetical protein BV898_01445 [Hypsibius exemplaris]|uniref:Secreted protein n=1 Tax=Hypsibius exemplaris TaxID=2072580 RepID=A0A1W0XBH9_HYPEX|nr:hypothetical protein BV898_01445 [Hypsibius exemplaris]